MDEKYPILLMRMILLDENLFWIPYELSDDEVKKIVWIHKKEKVTKNPQRGLLTKQIVERRSLQESQNTVLQLQYMIVPLSCPYRGLLCEDCMNRGSSYIHA